MQILPWSPRRLLRDDEGFSLVEAVVALAIAGVVFTALAFALVGGAHATVLSRQNQQAGDVLNKVVEQARKATYDALTMRATDLDTGEVSRSPRISACGCYDPKVDATSGAGVEPLAATDPSGVIYPHVSATALNGQQYSLRRYVTVPADAAGTYKRFTVVLSWQSLGKTHTRTYSTVIAYTTRGLPLPDFKFTNGDGLGQCRNPGSTVYYTFTVKNNGARDAWTLSAAPASNPTWTFYGDSDGDGTWTSADSPLALTSTGQPTTGLIEPTRSVTVFAVATLADAATRSAPYTLSTIFTAASVAQPSFTQQQTTTTSVVTTACGAAPTPTPTPTATATATPTATPTPTTTATSTPTPPTQPAPSCSSLTSSVSTSAPGGTIVRYYFTNASTPGNTTAQTGMPLLRDTGSALGAGPLFDFSTDLSSAAGRYLDQGTTTSTAPRNVASWLYTMPAASTVKGSGAVTVWAAPPTGVTTLTPQFQVVVDVVGGSTLGSATFTTPSPGWGCAGFRPFTMSIVNQTGSGVAVGANQQLRVRVLLLNSVPMLLAYGTTSYPMELDLPYSKGQG
jgi:type II secretory pathway pseudopilin PulG